MKIVSIYSAVLFCFVASAPAIEIVVRASSDEVLLIEGSNFDTVEEIECLVNQWTDCPEHARKEVFGETITPVNSLFDQEELKPEASVIREYQDSVTPAEKQDIAYIVNTLSDQPTPKLLFYKTSLNQAGDRINHVHPLNFIGVVFSDEVLRVKVRNIQRKGWVWHDFMGGIRKSMNDEHAKNNLKQEYFDDFALKIGIEYQKIKSPISKRDWDDLVTILIKHAESQGDNDRYNM